MSDKTTLDRVANRIAEVSDEERDAYHDGVAVDIITLVQQEPLDILLHVKRIREQALNEAVAALLQEPGLPHDRIKHIIEALKHE